MKAVGRAASKSGSNTETIALYARVSSEEQAERQTIQNQLEFLRGYAKLHELTVYREYIDDGVSGMLPVHERPSGAELIKDAAEGHFNVVVFYKIDRLSRSLRHLLDLHDTLQEYHVTLRSGTEPFDTSTPFGTFMMQLLGGMAELQRKDLLERTSQGKMRAVKSGKFSGGMIPFGYDVDALNDKLIQNPAEISPTPRNVQKSLWKG